MRVLHGLLLLTILALIGSLFVCEKFTDSDPITAKSLNDIKVAFNITDQKISEMIQRWKAAPDMESFRYPAESAENKFLTAAMFSAAFDPQIAAEVESLLFANGINLGSRPGSPPPQNNPFQASTAEFIQSLPQSTPMPGSQFYAAINNLVTNNY